MTIYDRELVDLGTKTFLLCSKCNVCNVILLQYKCFSSLFPKYSPTYNQTIHRKEGWTDHFYQLLLPSWSGPQGWLLCAHRTLLLLPTKWWELLKNVMNCFFCSLCLKSHKATNKCKTSADQNESPRCQINCNYFQCIKYANCYQITDYLQIHFFILKIEKKLWYPITEGWQISGLLNDNNN